MSKIKLSESEQKTKDRLDRSHQVSALLKELFDQGFRTPCSVFSLFIMYYPKYVNPDEALKLRQFWNGKPRSQEMLDELQFIVNQVETIRK